MLIPRAGFYPFGFQGAPRPTYASDVRVSATLAVMGPATLETPAWLMRGIITLNARPGRLRLGGGRLSFPETGARTAEFDIAIADVRDVRFPRYNLGSVVRFDAGGESYRLAFLASDRRFKWSGARIRDVRPSRHWGKQWKAALKDCG